MKTRRSFLKQIITTSIVCFVNPVNLFSQLSNEDREKTTDNQKTDSNSKIRILKQEAKDAFYKRNYQASATLYTSLINSYPADVSNYDGLRKIFGTQHKHLEIVRLYQNGLKRNPELPVFYDRLAKALISLATGNDKDLNNYTDNENPVIEAFLLYLEAIEKAPKYKYLYLGLADIWSSINKRNERLAKRGKETIYISEELSEKVNLTLSKYRSEWVVTRASRNTENPYNLDFTSFTNKIAKKKRRTLYFADEKSNRERNISRMKRRCGDKMVSLQLKQNKFSQLLLLLMSMLAENNFSMNIMGKLKKGLNKSEHMNNFKLFYEAFYANRKDTWGLIGKAIYYKKYTATSSKSLEMLVQAENNIDVYSAKKLAAIYENQADIYFKLKNYAQGETALRKGLELLQDSGTSTSLMIKYAQGYALQGQYPKAVELLNYISNNGKTEIDTANIFHQLPSKDSEDYVKEEYLKVYYALSKIQYKQHDLSGLNNTLEKINRIDYENRFVQKMKTQLS